MPPQDFDQRIRELDARLIEQDHRLIAVLMRFFRRKHDYPDPKDPRRTASLKALFFCLFFSPASIAIGGGLLAVCSTTVLVWQSTAMERQITKMQEGNVALVENNQLIRTSLLGDGLVVLVGPQEKTTALSRTALADKYGIDPQDSHALRDVATIETLASLSFLARFSSNGIRDYVLLEGRARIETRPRLLYAVFEPEIENHPADAGEFVDVQPGSPQALRCNLGTYSMVDEDRDTPPELLAILKSDESSGSESRHFVVSILFSAMRSDGEIVATLLEIPGRLFFDSDEIEKRPDEDEFSGVLFLIPRDLYETQEPMLAATSLFTNTTQLLRTTIDPFGRSLTQGE